MRHTARASPAGSTDWAHLCRAATRRVDGARSRCIRSCVLRWIGHIRRSGAPIAVPLAWLAAAEGNPARASPVAKLSVSRELRARPRRRRPSTMPLPRRLSMKRFILVLSLSAGLIAFSPVASAQESGAPVINADGTDAASTAGLNPVANGTGPTLIYGDLSAGAPPVPIASEPAPLVADPAPAPDAATTSEPAPVAEPAPEGELAPAPEETTPRLQRSRLPPHPPPRRRPRRHRRRRLRHQRLRRRAGSRLPLLSTIRSPAWPLTRPPACSSTRSPATSSTRPVA